MMYLGNLREMTDDMCNYVIVRSPGKIDFSRKERIHVPELSPSWELLKEYNARKNESNIQEWFDTVYVPIFLREIAGRRESLVTLDSLGKKAMNSNVRIVCFCRNERMCHRSIIAGILKGAGVNVKCKEEYEKYYGMFMKLFTG